ncbi:hypothetical protein T459_05188 [Capsicum annuum]|uniref:Ubiquitin-like protease family profile domain-containing protein n=1 Tax=Capsicum annuum TaxID=4072 RepID=A0A2G3A751_CAPAN|nr:hypothetical protein T459_05188 [Capsicum annuum]
MGNELVTPLSKSSKQVDYRGIHRGIIDTLYTFLGLKCCDKDISIQCEVASVVHSVERHESFLGSSLVAYVGQFALKDSSLLDHVSDVIQNPQVSVHSCNIDHDIGHIPLSLCDANRVTSFAQGFSISAGFPWHLIDEVYIPINCGDEFHWVLAAFILKEMRIPVYDSMSGRRCPAPSSEIQNLAKILPTYLDMSGFFYQKVRTDWSTIKAYWHKMGNPFDVEYAEGISHNPLVDSKICVTLNGQVNTLPTLNWQVNIFNLRWLRSSGTKGLPLEVTPSVGR